MVIYENEYPVGIDIEDAALEFLSADDARAVTEAAKPGLIIADLKDQCLDRAARGLSFLITEIPDRYKDFIIGEFIRDGFSVTRGEEMEIIHW